MSSEVIIGLLIPFAGTSLGAAMVFFFSGQISDGFQKVLTGFASGVMVAASFWSLLLPALESSESGDPRLAVSSGICSRSDVLRGGGRTDPGNVRGETFQCRDHRVCRGICFDDDTRCGAWIREERIR